MYIIIDFTHTQGTAQTFRCVNVALLRGNRNCVAKKRLSALNQFVFDSKNNCRFGLRILIFIYYCIHHKLEVQHGIVYKAYRNEALSEEVAYPLACFRQT